MPRNASGVYSLPAGNPVVTNTTIASVWANNTLSDVGSEITNSLDRSGRGGMLAPIQVIDGAVGAPAYTFTNEPSTGIFRAGVGDIRIAMLGTERVQLTSTGIFTITGDISVTGNSTLGNNTGDTLNVAAGGIVRNSFGLGINNTLATGIPLRIQAEGFNDVGLEWQRVGAAEGTFLSYNRNAGTYAALRMDALQHTFFTSGNIRWGIDTSGHLVPAVNNAVNFGAAAFRPATVYSILGDFSGLLTAAGINFGGTTLSTYAVGTWVPGVTFGGAAVGITYGGQSAKYTRVGDVVFVQIFGSLTSKGSSVGVMAVTGLPFAAAAGLNSYFSVVMNQLTSTPAGIPAGFVAPAATTIALGGNQDIGSFTQYTNTNASNTVSFTITGWYKV